MFIEDELIPVSALQHAYFCERQYALIHIEQLWQENRYTTEGQVLHERVDVEHHESRRLFRLEYAMMIRSLHHGLIGKTDLVELHLKPEGGVAKAVPVEFKRGKNKESDCDRIQLCAQALCLEEMLGISIELGQFYYLQEHRRTSVEMGAKLRETTSGLILRTREIWVSRITPPALYEPQKCDRCSLLEPCMPKSAGSGGKRVDRYIQTQIRVNKAEIAE